MSESDEAGPAAGSRLRPAVATPAWVGGVSPSSTHRNLDRPAPPDLSRDQLDDSNRWGGDDSRRTEPLPDGGARILTEVVVPAGRVVTGLGRAFYGAALVVALAGATTAATGWLGWPLVSAAVAVAVVELGGVTLAARADFRRRLGEQALAARLLSAAVAGFAVMFQWLGHADHRQGLFFAGTSALAYTVWLINSADRRRDQLRVDGRLPVPAPVYGPVRWLRHPYLTWRAHAAALADPMLGLFGSLTAAEAAVRRERRQRALARLLRRRVTKGRDRLAARIVITTYDLDEIAARLAAGADYDGLTALIAAELHPARALDPAPDDQLTLDPVGDADHAVPESGSGADRPSATAASTRPGLVGRRPDLSGEPDQHDGGRASVRRGVHTAARIADVRDQDPRLSTVDIARQVGVTDRTVRRHVAAMRTGDQPAQHPHESGERWPM